MNNSINWTIESAVSHKKGEILPRHIPSPPLTTSHLLEVLIGVCFCSLCRVSNKSSPWLFNSVSSYPEVRTAAGRVFSRGGTVQVRPVMIMGLLCISVSKKSNIKMRYIYYVCHVCCLFNAIIYMFFSSIKRVMFGNTRKI